MRAHKQSASLLHATAGLCMTAFVVANAILPQPPGWSVVAGMLIVLVTLWIGQAHHAEMASRYHSLYEQVASGTREAPTLFIKRPAKANVAAMWGRGETFFYLAAALAIVLMAVAHR